MLVSVTRQCYYWRNRDRGTLRVDPAFHMETNLSLTVEGTTVSVDEAQVDQMLELFVLLRARDSRG
jgi:hypothetical protein